MQMLSRVDQQRVAREASRAPSAHNTQPARWQFLEDGRVRLYEDTTRRLPFADPTGRDAQIGLGTAVEGMHLALSQVGWGLGGWRPCSPDPSEGRPNLVPVAEASLFPTTEEEPLAEFVPRRFTYRGKFARPHRDALAPLNQLLEHADDLVVFDDAKTIGALARLHDRCSLEFLSMPDYQTELYEWLRFSPRDSNWTRDGLTADCLELSAVERVVARYALQPGVFRVLRAARVARPMISEAAAVRSASVIVALHAARDESWISIGRRFYRFLLELTSVGFAACPMSSLVDSPRGVERLREITALPDDRVFVNVFRIGPMPRHGRPRSPRLPVDEILL